ncbi:MAG: hypothetical protein ACOCXI_04870, partial [Chloroflexota bacterium]
FALAIPSPAGRWLYTAEYLGRFDSQTPGTTIFTLLDLEQDTRRDTGGGRDAAWSPDGLWLAKLYERYVLLWNVAEEYKTIVHQDLSACRIDTWRDR